MGSLPLRACEVMCLDAALAENHSNHLDHLLKLGGIGSRVDGSGFYA